MVTLEHGLQCSKVCESIRLSIFELTYFRIKTLDSPADTTVSPFDPCDALNEGVSTAVLTPIHPLSHPWDHGLLLGLASTLNTPSPNAPVPPACQLQRVLSDCKPSTGHGGNMVGEDLGLVQSRVHCHGGPVKHACSAEAGQAGAGFGRRG